ncbi:MAG: phage terminase large subunit [Ignavibacterium sp.]|nr:phage terminase large subunit [Ignavibacterium sp.]
MNKQNDFGQILYIPGYHDIQQNIFLDDEHKIKIVAKGRRFGLTKGMGIYVVEKLLARQSPILWVDTIYSNIKRYVEIYILPEIKKYVPDNEWSYNKTEARLFVFEGYCDFRSADRPENIEGYGYRHIIINEAGIVLKNRNLWLESILPMTIDYDADVIIGGTPKGKKVKNAETHLFYELSLKEKENKRYKTFNYSTYDNPLLKKELIKEVESEIPPHLREQEIYGKFIDKAESGIIKNEWWKFINENEVFKERVIKKIQIWDTAFKQKQENDFSVCETWIITTNKYILINVYRDRMEFPKLKRAAVEQYEKYRPNEVWIEDKASGISLIQEMQRETRIPIKAITADKEKLEYINAITPLIEQGKVYLLKNKDLPTGQAGWLKEFMEECEEYPNVEFDDQIDIMAKFLNEAKAKIAEGIPQLKTFVRKDQSRYKGFRK